METKMNKCIKRFKTSSRYLILAGVAASSGAFANHLTTNAQNGGPATGGNCLSSNTTDTTNLQKALTYCSNNNLVCEIPAGVTYCVTKPIFMWGGAWLISSNHGGIKFNDTVADPAGGHLFNLGISGKNTDGTSNGNHLEAVFSGTISNVDFTVVGSPYTQAPYLTGAVLYFWRTDGAKITNNYFNIGAFHYSGSTSTNNNDWVVGGSVEQGTLIKRNITIKNNTILANAGEDGGEGFGLNDFSQTDQFSLIQGNVITGVGDDAIGLHFCKNVKVLSNILRTTDGRIAVLNSTNIEIGNNKIIRFLSREDQHTELANAAGFYAGWSLISASYEGITANGDWPAPEAINIHDNQLYFPKGSQDYSGAIQVTGARNISVTNNIIVNDASTYSNYSWDTSGFKYYHYALSIHPIPLVNWWDPSPTNPDTTTSCTTSDGTPNCVARIHGPITIDGNISGVTQGSGATPLSFSMWDKYASDSYDPTYDAQGNITDVKKKNTNSCADYIWSAGSIKIINNNYPSFINMDISDSVQAKPAIGTFKTNCSSLIVTDSTKPNTTTLKTYPDTDGDKYPDMFDNCPSVSNPLQEDTDGNGVGNACVLGLIGNYYNNKTFLNPPALTRVDAGIYFYWGPYSPASGVVNADNFSVRWTGKVVPPVSGTYSFCATADDTAKLWVNGVKLPPPPAPDALWNEQCGSITLTAYVPVPIQMDYVEGGGGAIAQLQWSYPGQVKQPIPVSQLYTQ
jgi:hypothetical protein